MANRWVKHFNSEYSFKLAEEINSWCAKNNATPISISVYKVGCNYAAEVIVEGRDNNG